MADFCKACSIKNFGNDYEDLKNITKEKDWKEGKASVVICEGCGVIQVNLEGNCVSEDCLEKGKPGHGMPWICK